MNFAESAHELSDYIIGWRRHFHQYPELSFREFETTETLCRELTALGIPFTRYEDQPGVLAKITGSRPGGSVLLRADIDALPIRENTDLAFASENGAMHACGHDCHTAMLLGAARFYRSTGKKFPVRCTFSSNRGRRHAAELRITSTKAVWMV